MHTLKIKPLGVNKAYSSRRFATDDLKQYKKDLAWLLPRKMNVPEGQLEIHFEWGLSNSLADCDGPCKNFLDILSERYGFNDNRVYRIVQEKVVVKKGEEYIRFEILPYEKQKRAE